jgi:hypothetical protein
LREGEKDLAREIQSLSDKAEKLQEDLDEGEAIDILEDAVDEAERLGASLEESES